MNTAWLKVVSDPEGCGCQARTTSLMDCPPFYHANEGNEKIKGCSISQSEKDRLSDDQWGVAFPLSRNPVSTLLEKGHNVFWYTKGSTSYVSEVFSISTGFIAAVLCANGDHIPPIHPHHQSCEHHVCDCLKKDKIITYLKYFTWFSSLFLPNCRTKMPRGSLHWHLLVDCGNTRILNRSLL